MLGCIKRSVDAGHITLEDAQALQRRIDQIIRAGIGPAAAREQVAKELEFEKAERKRRALLTETVRKTRVDDLLAHRNARGQADPAEAFRLLHENFGEGKMQDLESHRLAIMGQAHAKLDALLHEFRKGAISGDLRRRYGSAKARLDNVVREAFGEGTGDAAAKALAQAWADVADDLRQRFNAAGGAVGKLEKWGLPQHHDDVALLNAGKAEWVRYVTPLLDLDRMVSQRTGAKLTPDELAEALSTMWDRVTTAGWIDREPTGQAAGKGALFRQHADHRFLVFKNADAWLRYQRDFGSGDPFAAMAGHISVMARDIAHMEVLGPNPEAMRKYLREVIQSRAANVKPALIRIAEAKAAVDRVAAQVAAVPPAFTRISQRLDAVHAEMAAIRERYRPQLGGKPSRADRARLDALNAEMVKLDGELRAASQMDGEAPPPKSGMVRLYHGGMPYGGGPRWFSTNKPYAEGYAAKNVNNGAIVSYIDVPESHPKLQPAWPDQGVAQGFTFNFELPEEELLGRVRPLIGSGANVPPQLAAEFRTALDALSAEQGKAVPWDEKLNPQDATAAALFRADAMWDVQRGTHNLPVNSRVANTLATTRNLIAAAALGSAALSAVSDVAFGVMARRFAGLPVSGTVREIVRQFRTANRLEAVRAGLMLDSAMHVMDQQARYVGSIQTRHVSGFLVDRVLGLQGLTAWTQAGKHAFGMAMQAEFASRVALPLADLPQALRDTLERHGITAAEWDAIRAAPAYEPEPGVQFLRPAEIERAAGRATAEKYLAMILRETRFAVPEGGVRSQSILTAGRPGTLAGEVTRNFSQFKSFSIVVMMLHGGRVAREIGAGRGAKGAAYAGSLLIGGTLLGALALQLKELANGRDPRDMDSQGFWGAALLQGGGLGIYGDFLLANVNRLGGGLTGTIAGPLVGRADQLRNRTIGNALEAADGDKTNAGREAVQTLRDWTPGGNLWYLRLAYERTVLDQLQHLADPDARAAFRRRMQQRQRDYGNEFWWRPGETAPRRAPQLLPQ
jgi:hypothetical protein